MGTSLAQKYKKSLEESWFMKFKTTHPDNDTYSGIVVHTGPRFIILYAMIDFEPFGLEIMPKKVIKGYRDGKFERCFNKIIREYGQLRKLRVPKWLTGCNSISDILMEMKKRDIWPGIEVTYRYKRKRESTLYLGRIVDFYDYGFVVQHYDAEGKWEDVYEIDYDGIFRICFNGSYEKYFNRYMRKHNPPADYDPLKERAIAKYED